MIPDPQPGFRIRIDLMRIRIRIQHFFLLRIRIPDPDPGFDNLNWKKNYSWKFNLFFWSKIAIYLSLGLHEGHPSYRRSPQKRTSSTSKHEKSVLFSFFVGHFCPPGSGSGSAIWMRIRIQQLKLMRIHPDSDTDPDPKPCPQHWFYQLNQGDNANSRYLQYI